MQNKKPFPREEEDEEKHPELKAGEAPGQRQTCVWYPRAQRSGEILQFATFARIGRLKSSPTVASRKLPLMCFCVRGALSDKPSARVSLPCARAELENPTKRTVFSSYMQIGWSKTELKTPTAASFLRNRRWFQARVLSLAPVPRASAAACIHTNSHSPTARPSPPTS